MEKISNRDYRTFALPNGQFVGDVIRSERAGLLNTWRNAQDSVNTIRARNLYLRLAMPQAVQSANSNAGCLVTVRWISRTISKTLLQAKSTQKISGEPGISLTTLSVTGYFRVACWMRELHSMR